MNSLDQYLNLFDNISWHISDGGNTSDIYYNDTDQPIHTDPRFQQLLVPLTTGPIKIYFVDEDGNEVEIEYPAGLRGIDILGAINTFYDRPISQQFYSELLRSPAEYGLDIYPEAAEKIQRGQVPAIRDFLVDKDRFAAIRKYKDGYEVIVD